MNRRLLLVLVLLLLGGLAWWLQRNSAPTTLDQPLADFAVPDTAAVTRIFIVDQQGKRVDLRRSGAIWTVNGRFPAKQADINLLLRTFKRVEVKSPVPRSAQAYTLRVMGAAARKVEIYEGGDVPSKIWIVGHGTQDHFGTFMLLEKPGVGRSNAPFIMGMGGFTGILGTRFHTDEDAWRNTTYFHLDDLRNLASVQVETPLAPANSYTISQDTDGRFGLKDHQGRAYPFDTILVHGAVLPTQQLNFESIQRLTPTKRDSLLRSTPNHILTLTPRNGAPVRARLWYRPYAGEEPGFGVPRPLFDPIYMDALLQDTLFVVMQRPALDRMLQPISGFHP